MLADERALLHLIETLRKEDKQMYVRRKVEEALAAIGAPAMPHLLEMLNDEDIDVRTKAVETLGVIGDTSAAAPLIELLSDKSKEVKIRSVAIEALGNLGPVALEPLVEALTDLNVAIRRRAATALGKVGDPAAVGPLIEALRDKDVYVKDNAALALGIIGDPSACEALVEALRDCVWDAAKALIQIGEASIAPLSKALGDHAVAVRARAANALIEICGVRAVEPLAGALRNESWGVRKSAVDSLLKIDDPSAIEPLIEALNDPYWAVRSSAAEALGNIGDPRAIDALRNLLGDPDEIVRTVAKDVVEKLSDSVE